MPKDAGHLSRWLLAAMLLSCAAAPCAAGLGELYEVTVPAAGIADAQVFRQGMASLLVRITGRRDAATLPALAPLLDDAGRYVSSYRRASAGLLAIRFDAEAVEQAVSAAGLPFWAEQRPRTLVWLAVDRGGGQPALAGHGADPERAVLEQVAEERGVPLVWPSLAGGAEARRRAEQVWGGDTGSLAAEAPNYGASGVLIGRALAAGGTYAVDWTFLGAGGGGQVSGNLGEGVHLAADRYAGLYATAEAGRRDELDVLVAGVGDLQRYAEATRRLESLPGVRAVSVRQVRPDSVVFSVAVRGGLDSLRRAAAADGRLVPLDAATGEAAFRLQP